MKTILFTIYFLIGMLCNAQYIAVKARYTETRVVDDNAPLPPSRENRLILSFYHINNNGEYVPVNLTNFDLWIFKEGLQYGNVMGGVMDSTGNNYPGYTYTAPKVVSYHNSYQSNYMDCSPTTTHFVVNGYELDCGFIRVSHWDYDYGNGQELEMFTAPNVCLPFYLSPHPYSLFPGNVNFNWPNVPTEPYNWYVLTCYNSPQNLVVRGVLAEKEDSLIATLPVRFANVNGALIENDQVTIRWTNLSESEVDHYMVEKTDDGNNFQELQKIAPEKNDGSEAHYDIKTYQGAEASFYRIIAIESNGSRTTSPVVSIKKRPLEISSELIVFPNPAREFTIRLRGAPPGRYLAYIINAEGRYLKQKMINHASGDLIKDFSLWDLPLGIYQFVLQSPYRRYHKQIINGY